MLYNSDGIPVIFMGYQKVYIFKCHCWSILPVFTILSKQKIKIGKICNMKKCVLQREQDLVFQKAHRLIIRVVLYSAQYGSSIT